MNWTQFVLLLTGVYFFYYGANIAIDLFRSRQAPRPETDVEQLVFDDDTEPELITYDEAPEVAAPTAPEPEPVIILSSTLTEPAINASGGLSLKELIRAAQENLIDFTGAIPY